MAKQKPETKDGIKIVVRNRKARHDYEIIDTIEAGLVLLGSEVKSLRAGRVSLSDAYATPKGDELYLVNLHISPYDKATVDPHEPTRARKLLLHKRQIRRLLVKIQERGFTLIPLQIHFREGRAKVEIALARGKRRYDKRDAIAKRDAQRDLERIRAARERD